MNTNTVSPSNSRGANGHGKTPRHTLQRAGRLRELVFAMLDATDNGDFEQLHAALTRYLQLPLAVRLELDRMDYGDNKGVITQ